MQIIWLRNALFDLRDIRSYYEQIASIETSEKIINKIYHSVEILSAQPYIGRPSQDVRVRELVVPKTNYILPYCIVEDKIQILRVFDGRQEPLESWFIKN